MLDVLRERMILSELPAEAVSDDDLRAGLRRVVRDIEEGRLNLIDMANFSPSNLHDE
jgi:hypothetical protein